MKSLNAQTKKKIDRLLKHPLFITLVGSLVASALIPWIVGRSNAQAVLAKARIDHALEMMNTSGSVNTLLNKMKTEFEAFEKDSLRASPNDYRQRCEELRHRIYSLHSDFDGLAWWWPWTISYRAHVLGLVSERDFQDLQSKNAAYNQNLIATCHELDKPWAAYLRADASQPKPAAQAIMPGLNSRLGDLQSERDELVRKMAALFQ